MPDDAPHSVRQYELGYEEEGRLRGFGSACGFRTATWALLCPRCGERDLTEVELGRVGRIAAVTVQTVPAEQYLNDAPYAYLLVDLDGGGRVTGWMAGVSPGSPPTIGRRVRFVPGYRRGVQFELLPDEAPRG